MTLRDAWGGRGAELGGVSQHAGPRLVLAPREAGGLRMTFTDIHRPIHAYFDALAAAGLVVDRLVEVGDTTDPPGDRWQRLPLFLDFRAAKR